MAPRAVKSASSDLMSGVLGPVMFTYFDAACGFAGAQQANASLDFLSWQTEGHRQELGSEIKSESEGEPETEAESVALAEPIHLYRRHINN